MYSVEATLSIRGQNIRVTSRGDEVQQSVNSVIPETGVTFNTRLLSKDVIVLAFKMTNDFLEAASTSEKGTRIVSKYVRKFIVNIITKTRCINNSQCNSDTIFFEFWKSTS